MNAQFKDVRTLRLLHIHNGDSTANTARQAPIPGEHFAFREALIAGPAPSDLKDADWRKLRAAHLSAAYGVGAGECEQDLLRQEETLLSYPAHEEIVLWFEHDLFCQVNLIYLLDWFAARDLRKTKLSLICVGEFTGLLNFRGLGELNEAQLASLFGSRHEVTAAELRTGSAAWAAYCSPEPAALQSVLRRDTSALPFLQSALRCHLARFPSLNNGLGRIENRGLALINDGLETFVDLFPRFGDAEPGFGLGDFQFYVALKQLSDARSPLLKVTNGDRLNGMLDSEKIRTLAFAVTATGEAVLKGEADFVELNGIDLWLGGVHLSESNLWRWDEQKQEVVRG
jgi:hypothetical protein